ncbi:MAG TPA: diacylglyceryl transferase [Flavobacteriales bacterium]|nr:diacylglyceryl transferase [Flavobacteriales bacterium]
MTEGRENKPGWVQRLAKRWNVSPASVGIILLVFACTGFSVLFLKRPLVAWASGDDGTPPLLFSVLYYILILPVYNLLLLFYGAVFGQFSFFWAFEKRFFARLFGRRKP